MNTETLSFHVNNAASVPMTGIPGASLSIDPAEAPQLSPELLRSLTAVQNVNIGVAGLTGVTYPPVIIGDPPGPCPGVTIVPIGEPWKPVPYETVPNLPWVPAPGLSGYLNVQPSPWNVTWHADRVVARADVPGVRVADLSVEIENGSLRVSGKRFDTLAPVSLSVVIGPDFDPKTAEASLEAGVLTVTVKKLVERLVHKVAVVAK